MTAAPSAEPTMSRTRLYTYLTSLTAALAVSVAPQLVAQTLRETGDGQRRAADQDGSGDEVSYSFKSRADSLAWSKNRALAARSTGFRLVVSLQDRHLWAIIGRDTVLSAPAAVAKGTTLEFGKREWTFDTPRGMRTVLSKEADPIWQPPEWLYAETALENGLKLGHLNSGSKVKLGDGRFLTVRDGVAGVIDGGMFAALPTDEHIVFDNTLFIPPMGSKNRKIEGELGKYRLNLGDGYLLHGTPYKESIGLAATHGCVRMRDEDIEWLYDHVPVGTRVYIY
jgi:hypothetical protein